MAPIIRTRTSRTTANGRRTRSVAAAVLLDIDRQCADVGWTHRSLARAADLDPGFVSQVFAGQRLPSLATLVAMTTALGADLAVRAYPGSGPAIHDRHQARIEEALLSMTVLTWGRFLEVAVRRPARGFIDIVFDHPIDDLLVATEIESRLDRLEQQLRWAQEKAASLPSADLWTHRAGDPAISRLLVLRSTRATRELATRFEAILAAAYPARTADVYASLATGSPWPGAGILWADIRGNDARILTRPPRGIAIGR